MMYTVVRHFSDLLDKNHKYLEGDVYPREGYTPSPERIAELSSENNKQKTVLIKAISEESSEVETVETSAEEEPTPQEEKPKKSTKRTKKAE